MQHSQNTFFGPSVRATTLRHDDRDGDTRMIHLVVDPRSVFSRAVGASSFFFLFLLNLSLIVLLRKREYFPTQQSRETRTTPTKARPLKSESVWCVTLLLFIASRCQRVGRRLLFLLSQVGSPATCTHISSKASSDRMKSKYLRAEPLRSKHPARFSRKRAISPRYIIVPSEVHTCHVHARRTHVLTEEKPSSSAIAIGLSENAGHVLARWPRWDHLQLSRVIPADDYYRCRSLPRDDGYE